MIPKDFKRLAEVNLPIAELSLRIKREAGPVRAGRPGGPVVHTLLIRSAAGFAWRNHSQDGVS